MTDIIARGLAANALSKADEAIVFAAESSETAKSTVATMIAEAYSAEPDAIAIPATYADVADQAQLLAALTAGNPARLTADITITSAVNITGKHIFLNGFAIRTAGTTTDPVQMFTSTSGGVVLGPGTLEHKKTSNTSVETVFSSTNNGQSALRVQGVTIRVMEFAAMLNGAFEFSGCKLEYAGAANNSHRYFAIYSVRGNSWIDKNTFDCQPKNVTTRYTNFVLMNITDWTDGATLHVRHNKQGSGDLRQFLNGESFAAGVTSGRMVIHGNSWDDFNGGAFLLGSNCFDRFKRIVLTANEQGSSAAGSFKGLFYVSGTGPLGTQCDLVHYGNSTNAGALRADYVSIAPDSSNIIAAVNTITLNAGQSYPAQTSEQAVVAFSEAHTSVGGGSTPTVTIQASSSTFPSGANEGDTLYVTTDGTDVGEVIEVWGYTGTKWVQTKGPAPISGAVIDNTIADPALLTVIGRYIAPATGLVGDLIGHANEFFDWDGISVTNFVAPTNNQMVSITFGVNAGQKWQYTTAGGWAQYFGLSNFTPSYIESGSPNINRIHADSLGVISTPITLSASTAMCPVGFVLKSTGVLSSPLGSGITANGGGQVEFAGDNTYFGNTTVQGGTNLIVSKKISNGNYNITNGRLEFRIPDNQFGIGVISGSGNFVKSGLGEVVLTAGNTHTGTMLVQEGTIQIGNGGATGSTTSPAVDVSAGATFSYFRDTTNVPVTATLTGGGTYKFIGTGLNNQSSYQLLNNNNMLATSNFVVDKALVIAQNQNGLGINNPTIYIEPFGQVRLTNPVTFSSNFVIKGNGWTEADGSRFGALNVVGIGATNFTGNIVLAANSRINTATSAEFFISGQISESGGSFNLEKTGPGALRLNGIMTYTGTTTIAAGTVSIEGTSISSLTTVASGAAISGRFNTTGTVGPLTFAAIGSTFNVNGVTATSTGKLTCTTLSAPNGFTINMFNALNPGTYPILVKSAGYSGTPTLGTNTTGRSVTFAWSGNTLNAVLT